MSAKLDLINPADRLVAMERVTAEGLLSLSKETVRGNEYHVFAEAPKNLREYYELGLAHGDWEHIIYQDERIKYPETFARACQLGNTLQSKYGVKKGDKVKSKEVIGEVFTNQQTGKTEVHFSIFNNIKVLNPIGWIYRM